MKVAVITANTDIYRGNAENTSGRVIQKMMQDAGQEVVFVKALPCDEEVLTAILEKMVEGHLADIILTTGGAGSAAGDCMPEATKAVINREIPGIPEALRAYTMRVTKRAMLNRGVAGFSDDVLIVNLPGKANAVKQCLEYILPEVIHAAEIGCKRV